MFFQGIIKCSSIHLIYYKKIILNHCASALSLPSLVVLEEIKTKKTGWNSFTNFLHAHRLVSFGFNLFFFHFHIFFLENNRSLSINEKKFKCNNPQNEVCTINKKRKNYFFFFKEEIQQWERNVNECSFFTETQQRTPSFYVFFCFSWVASSIHRYVGYTFIHKKVIECLNWFWFLKIKKQWRMTNNGCLRHRKTMSM